MTIPAPYPLDAAALHGPVARNGVFNDTRKQRTVVRYSGDERWAVIENVTVVGRALGHRLFKGLIIFPVLYKVFFVFDCPAAAVLLVLHGDS